MKISWPVNTRPTDNQYVYAPLNTNYKNRNTKYLSLATQCNSRDATCQRTLALQGEQLGACMHIPI